jgi:hypothetical protein
VLTAICTAACLPRDRINAHCDWAAEPAVRLDLRNAGDLNHLSVDAQVAEELSIRYGDVTIRQECPACARGGPIRATRWREIREACHTTLVAAIARLHDVTPPQIDMALERRSVLADVGTVFVPMVMLVAFVANFVVRRLDDDMRDEAPRLMLIAMLAASLIVSAIAVPVGEIWAGIAEAIRIGNGHVSNRAFRMPWVRHRSEILAGGVLVFWMVAVVRHGASSMSAITRRTEDRT